MGSYMGSNYMGSNYMGSYSDFSLIPVISLKANWLLKQEVTAV